MKFLCDVHISYKLAHRISDLGYECIHVNTILDKWFTKDRAIATFVDQNDYILISKDVDFKNSFLIQQSPKKLIKVNLGNVSNRVLTEIISNNLELIKKINYEHKRFIIEINKDFIELNSF